MKQRVVVMNGQRLVESERAGKCRVDKVDKADGLKPYIYNIYLALQADKTKVYTGPILHTDQQFIYQLVKEGFVRHDIANIDIPPGHGVYAAISYKKGKAQISITTEKLPKKNRALPGR